MLQKYRRYEKQTKIFVLIGVLIMGILSPCAALRVDAAPKWKNAYKKILKNWRLVEKYDDMSYLKQYFGDDYGFDRYFTYDLNKDGTPELFLYSTTMGLTEVLTCKNGKITGLGYEHIYGIKKSKKAVIINGHWHGSGGSGEKEWAVYTMGKKKLKQKYYMDIWNGEVNVNFSKSTKSAYNKVYKEYVKGTTKLGKFKKYKLTDTKGLK